MTDRHRTFRARHADRLREVELARSARRSARSDEEVAFDCARLRPAGVKWCPSCRQRHRLAAFYRNRSKPDGLAPVCTLCALVAHRARTLRPSPL